MYRQLLKELPAGVRVVAVSKTRSLEQMQTLYDAGCRDFGENRVPEALEKVDAWHADVQWHFIGTLQRKKVPKIIGRFSLIHAVDTVELAEKIASVSHERGVTTAVLLQVNTSGEEAKHGLSRADWEPHLERLRELPGIDIRGLMTMAPLTDDVDVIRACFRGLREARDAWGLQELSMGMSNDYKIAIEEGATVLRIGRMLFKE